MKLRIKFSKQGVIRYIGHLDLMRYFQKTIRRAGIDVSYSGGFSPHQIMSFAAPLGVGLTSNGEYMDIQVDSFTDCEDVKTRINAVSIPEIQVLSVKILPDNAENAMASVAAAEYTISFKENKAPSLDFASCIEKLMQREEILFIKEGKKGTREVNLRPGIYRFEYKYSKFRLLVDASSGGNIKPVQVMTALLAETGKELEANSLHIVREEVYTSVETEEGNKLIPLEELGHE